MSSTWRVGAISLAFLAAFATGARAEDISAKKILIKDSISPAKRQIQAQSADVGVQFSEADDPATNGASIHVYSATEDQCIILPPGADWVNKNSLWKYKNKTTKDQAQIRDGKLLVKVRSGITYSLAGGTQGAVNVQVQFGDLGARYCMRCSAPKKDDTKIFIATKCALAACDAEPSSCDPNTTTTTTSTTTTTNPPGIELQGALPPTNGRFNYNLVLGVPGANAACNTNFPGTHACTFAELLIAESAGDLDGLKDINNTTVTSFWAIDPARPNIDQCTVTVAWDYATAHTGQKADRAPLNNGTGDLGALSSLQACGGSSWVGCCF